MEKVATGRVEAKVDVKSGRTIRVRHDLLQRDAAVESVEESKGLWR